MNGGLPPGLKEVTSPTAANAFEHKYSSLHIRDFNLDSTFQLSRTYARRLVRTEIERERERERERGRERKREGVKGGRGRGRERESESKDERVRLKES